MAPRRLVILLPLLGLSLACSGVGFAGQHAS
jgi:hypothetical protein